MRLLGYLGALAITLLASFAAYPAMAQDKIDAASLPCVSCHNDTTLIVSKQAQFHHSRHGSGDAYERGGSASCAGCHGSEGASARIEAGKAPHDASVVGIVNVSPINCRTCHDIHKTFTTDDFGIVGKAAAVTLEMGGTVYDGGAGNLCANCHQVRNETPVAENGMIEVTSSRFGPHHGVEAQMMMGEGGMGIRSRPNVHYKRVEDTCVNCHMGPVGEKDPNDPLPALARNHTFEPQVGYCIDCHEGLNNFDYEGVQTEVQVLIDEVKPLLIAKGIMDGREGMENRSVPGTYPEEVVNAMWNYMLVVEDASKGVHHSDWAKQLLEYGKEVLSQ